MLKNGLGIFETVREADAWEVIAAAVHGLGRTLWIRDDGSWTDAGRRKLGGALNGRKRRADDEGS